MNKIRNNMLQPKINGEQKVTTGGNADQTSHRTTFENSKNMGQIALGVAIVAPYELVKMGASLVSNKISELRGKSFSPDREELKLSDDEIKKQTSREVSNDNFNNFKIMGRIALGVAILLPYELVKMGASLVSDKISELRGKSFSPDSTIKDKNRL